MNIIHVVILSLVEGLTEFLPISSTGHLILASKLFGLPDSDYLKTFEIVIQLGAILAVFTLYSKKLLESAISGGDLIKKIFVAFIPTAIIGFTLYPFIKSFLLSSSAITLNALFWGGIIIILIEMVLKKSKVSKTQEMQSVPSYKQALLIGSFQSLSVVPGVSRAAATIVGGLVSGLSRTAATEFSFLLAIPTMIAASGLDIWKSRDVIAQGGALSLFLGTSLSFLFAMLAIKFLIAYVKKHDFTIFGIYRIGLAILFWLFVK